jgi:hypothetical protein
MGPATIRRLASVAAIILVAIVWCRPAADAGVAGPVQGAEASDRPMVARAPGGAGAAAAVIRQSHAGWLMHGARPDQGKGPLAAAVVALVLLLSPVLWDRSDRPHSALSSLARRRHVIALRAPPPPLRV